MSHHHTIRPQDRPRLTLWDRIKLNVWEWIY